MKFGEDGTEILLLRSFDPSRSRRLVLSPKWEFLVMNSEALRSCPS